MHHPTGTGNETLSRRLRADDTRIRLAQIAALADGEAARGGGRVAEQLHELGACARRDLAEGRGRVVLWTRDALERVGAGMVEHGQDVPAWLRAFEGAL